MVDIVTQCQALRMQIASIQRSYEYEDSHGREHLVITGAGNRWIDNQIVDYGFKAASNVPHVPRPGSGVHGMVAFAGPGKSRGGGTKPSIPVSQKIGISPDLTGKTAQGLKAESDRLRSIIDPTYQRVGGDEMKVSRAAGLALDARLKDNADWQKLAQASWGNSQKQSIDIMGEKYTPSQFLLLSLYSSWTEQPVNGRGMNVAMRMAAIDEFGLGVKTHAADAETQHEANVLYQEHGAALRAYVRAVYDETQSWFKEHGISEITLYRGINPKQTIANYTFDGIGKTLQITPEAFSSMTSDIVDVAHYADASHRDHHVIFAATYSPKQILAAPGIGMAKQNEQEFLVLGQPNQITRAVAWQGTRGLSADELLKDLVPYDREQINSGKEELAARDKLSNAYKAKSQAYAQKAESASGETKGIYQQLASIHQQMAEAQQYLDVTKVAPGHKVSDDIRARRAEMTTKVKALKAQAKDLTEQAKALPAITPSTKTSNVLSQAQHDDTWKQSVSDWLAANKGTPQGEFAASFYRVMQENATKQGFAHVLDIRREVGKDLGISPKEVDDRLRELMKSGMQGTSPFHINMDSLHMDETAGQERYPFFTYAPGVYGYAISLETGPSSDDLAQPMLGNGSTSHFDTMAYKGRMSSEAYTKGGASSRPLKLTASQQKAQDYQQQGNTLMAAKWSHVADLEAQLKTLKASGGNVNEIRALQNTISREKANVTKSAAKLAVSNAPKDQPTPAPSSKMTQEEVTQDRIRVLKFTINRQQELIKGGQDTPDRRKALAQNQRELTKLEAQAARTKDIADKTASLANLDIEALRQMAASMGLPITGTAKTLAKRIATKQIRQVARMQVIRMAQHTLNRIATMVA